MYMYIEYMHLQHVKFKQLSGLIVILYYDLIMSVFKHDLVHVIQCITMIIRLTMLFLAPNLNEMSWGF